MLYKNRKTRKWDWEGWDKAWNLKSSERKIPGRQQLSKRLHYGQGMSLWTHLLSPTPYSSPFLLGSWSII